MISTIAKQTLSWGLSGLLVIAAGSFEVAGQQPASTSGYSGQGAPLFPDELQQLVAPIALYPDGGAGGGKNTGIMTDFGDKSLFDPAGPISGGSDRSVNHHCSSQSFFKNKNFS
jgi:hypothetical protein